MWNAISLVSPCPIPTTITITPQVPPKTVSSCLCGIAKNPVARRRFFQQSPSWSRVALLLLGTWSSLSCCVRLWGQMNGGITSVSLVTTPNTMMQTTYLVILNRILSSDWHLNILISSYKNFRCEFNAVQYAVSKYLDEGIVLLCSYYSKTARNDLKWQQFTHRTQVHSKSS